MHLENILINTVVEAGIHVCIRKIGPSIKLCKMPPGAQKKLFSMNILLMPEQIERNCIHYIPISTHVVEWTSD